MKITTEVEIKDLTPEQLAEAFWDMDNLDQAKFFNRLASCVLASPAPYGGSVGTFYPLDVQMYEVAKECLPSGKRAMEMIGESTYGHRLQAYKLENEPNMEESFFTNR